MDKKRIATVSLIVLIDTAGATVIVPLIPVYVLAQFSATPFVAGVLIGAFFAAQMVAAPWLGKLSDRVGRRPVLLLSQVGTMLSYAMMLVAAPLGALLDSLGLGAHSQGITGAVMVIFLARILDGVTGGNISVAEAYASDISSPDERTRALGIVGGAYGLGFILGPALIAICGLLAPAILLAPFIAASAAAAVTLVLTLLWLNEPPQGREEVARPEIAGALWQVLRRRTMVLALGIAFLVMSYTAVLTGTFPLYADRVLFAGQSPTIVLRNVGALMTVLGLVIVLTEVAALKPLENLLGERQLVLIGSLLQVVSAAGFFAFVDISAVVVCVVVYGVGYGMSWPSLQSLITRAGAERMAGRLLGVLQAVSSLALILGPIWGGYVFGVVSPQSVFAISAALLVLAALGSLGLRAPSEPQLAAEGEGKTPVVVASTIADTGDNR